MLRLDPERAGRTALCLDFDGTLSPIVPDPTAAEPLPGTPELLTRLAGRFAAVALVSGRPAAELAARVPADGVRYLGLYGLEAIDGGHLVVDPRAEAARPAVRAAVAALTSDPAVTASGAWIEDKGLGVTLHLRRLADLDRWATPLETLAGSTARTHGLALLPGRLAFELRPAIPVDKGDAVRQVVAASGATIAIMIGDDTGDLPAFAAIAHHIATGHEGLRVAARSPESPPDLLAATDLTVDGPPGVRTLLQSWAMAVGA